MKLSLRYLLVQQCILHLLEEVCVIGLQINQKIKFQFSLFLHTQGGWGNNVLELTIPFRRIWTNF